MYRCRVHMCWALSLYPYPYVCTWSPACQWTWGFKSFNIRQGEIVLLNPLFVFYYEKGSSSHTAFFCRVGSLYNMFNIYKYIYIYVLSFDKLRFGRLHFHLNCIFFLYWQDDREAFGLGLIETPNCGSHSDLQCFDSSFSIRTFYLIIDYVSVSFNLEEWASDSFQIIHPLAFLWLLSCLLKSASFMMIYCVHVENTKFKNNCGFYIVLILT